MYAKIRGGPQMFSAVPSYVLSVCLPFKVSNTSLNTDFIE